VQKLDLTYLVANVTVLINSLSSQCPNMLSLNKKARKICCYGNGYQDTIHMINMA